MALDKTRLISESLDSVIIAINALQSAGITLTQEIIESVVKKSVEPAIQKANQITEATVNQQLHAQDAAKNSWTNEDPRSTAVKAEVH